MSLTITITEEGLHLNDKSIELPIATSEFISIIGPDFIKHGLKHSTVYTWNKEGLFAYETKGQVTGFMISIKPDKSYKFTPQSLFTGLINIDGKPLSELPVVKKKQHDDYFNVIKGKFNLYIGLNEQGEMAELEVSLYVPEVIPEPDKYESKPITGNKIHFRDFNFKLAVIQVLMYELNLLTPVFDVYEFVKRYKAREIDVDAEGYEIIPEVKNYFEALEIDQRHADAITEIYQDGGNDIYMNVIPFWSGETDDFNIQSFDDVDQFKNLKKITLFYDERLDEITEQMKKKGIEVDQL